MWYHRSSTPLGPLPKNFKMSWKNFQNPFSDLLFLKIKTIEAKLLQAQVRRVLYF